MLYEVITDAMHGSLNNNILLRMQTPAYFVPLPRRNAQLLTQTPYLKTMWNPGWRTIIARG